MEVQQSAGDSCGHVSVSRPCGRSRLYVRVLLPLTLGFRGLGCGPLLVHESLAQSSPDDLCATVAVHAQVTCLANSEEELSKRAALVPFLLQDALIEARPQSSLLPWPAASLPTSGQPAAKLFHLRFVISSTSSRSKSS